MNPNLLKQLAVIIKQGSISAAAEQLFVTQPTLTRAIQQLEQKVGAPVLKRTRYGVTPTEIGERLAAIGEKILTESEYSNEVIRQWNSGFRNEFTVGIDPLWEYSTVAQTTRHFIDEPRFAFHLRTGSAAAQIQLLKAEELDFLLGPAHVTVAQSTLSRTIVFRDRSAIFAGKYSPLLQNKQMIEEPVLQRQKWFVAGASAGFMNSNLPIQDNAAKITFTSSIRSVIHLLNTTDMLVSLPARLALMSGEIHPEQMLLTDERFMPRRDIALWSRQEHNERPDYQRIHNDILTFAKGLDEHTPTYGLAL